MTIVSLKLDNMAHGGDAVGRHNGQAVFVPFGIPGETVRVELTESQRRYVHARLIDVLEPSPARTEPPCPYFGLCGGCQWQHIAYEAQLDSKRRIVEELLTRIGRQPTSEVYAPLPAESPWAYRNHVQLKLDREGRIGLYAVQSHDVVPIDVCLVSHPLIDELWDALDIEFEGLEGVALRAGIATGEQLVLFEGASSEPPALEVDLPISCVYQTHMDELTILAGSSSLHEELLGQRFQISAPSFFQVNTAQAERLLQTVRAYLAPKPHERLLDAYCGVGVFAHALAPELAEVVGIESSPWALKDALANARTDNVTIIGDRVELALAEMDQTFDAIILDPPRAGCAPETLERLLACHPTRLVYVSCDPATLARDVRQMTAYGWQLERVQPIDMFPQTYHIECVALLRPT
jgi:23S rRNA (uracil1939-C5)-methyltransferase